MDRIGEEEEGIEHDPQIFGLSSWVESGAIYGNGEEWGRTGLIGKSYLDILFHMPVRSLSKDSTRWLDIGAQGRDQAKEIGKPSLYGQYLKSKGLTRSPTEYM